MQWNIEEITLTGIDGSSRIPVSRRFIMYRSFTVRNFRGFEELAIDSFERINLLAGKNNVGKTALLEAIWIHHDANNPDLGLRVDSFRGLDVVDSENFMSNLFFRFNRDLTIELSAEGDW
jgi:AAA15 family ATPase/GTPase